MKDTQMQTIITFLKSRGFVYQSSEIYGGLAGIYDYGPLGVEVLNNLKKSWWQDVVYSSATTYGLDGAIFQNPIVWESSGHTKNFSDPLIECRDCNFRMRVDDESFDSNCLKCNSKNLSEKKDFNLLVQSNLGSFSNQDFSPVYLRAETCQSIYLNFKNIINSFSPKLPFGVAQIGKAFRNEINPRKFLFRTREFEQAEAQYFCLPKDTQEIFNQQKNQRLNFLLNLGINQKKLRFQDHQDLVFYAKAATDIEYNFPDYGFSEIEGIHHRGNYDLISHAKGSGKDLSYFLESQGEKILPDIIETSLGLGRIFLAILIDAFQVEKLPDGKERNILKIHKNLAPYKIAILPLFKKDNLPEKAKEFFKILNKDYSVSYDENGSIGKRYRRQDEIGTPFCLTIGYEYIERGIITIRDRDSMEQVEVNATEQSLKEYFLRNF